MVETARYRAINESIKSLTHHLGGKAYSETRTHCLSTTPTEAKKYSEQGVLFSLLQQKKKNGK